jgi:decaheme cytochrome c component MtrC/MtrF-like protein
MPQLGQDIRKWSPNLHSSLRILCALCVSAVTERHKSLHRRDAESTDDPQRCQTSTSFARIPYLTRNHLLAASVLAAIALTSTSFGQTKPTRRNAPSRTTPTTDYSKFSHSTKKHQAACDTCHKIPTSGWQKTSAYPDILDYPGHDACVSCHRAQFFKGAKPPICSGCHTKTSPRDEARFAFRNPASQLQFTIEFPHDRHQDVIARFNNGMLRQSLNAFAHARLGNEATDDKSQTYNNCSICHVPRDVPSAPAAGWPDHFQPKPETFKSVPTGHDACFNCHWKTQQPIAQNCVGCHKLTSPFAASVPTRISLKFMHEGGGEKKNHIAECATCHINITKSVSVRGLKPDVPITSCTECHNKEGLRQDVSKELVAIDKNKGFVCVYCHTSNVGSLDPPASHYLIAERPPIKRKEIK